MLSQRAMLRASQPTTAPLPLGAPLGGWNTRDPIEAMQPTDAIVLENWYPDVAGVLTRRGSNIFADLLTGTPVYSLMAYQAGATAKLLAASSGTIWDITSQTPVSIGTGFSSDKWQSTNFNGKLFLANGSDTLQVFDGTTLSAATFTGTTLSEFVDVGSFHNRVFLWKASEAGFWYGGTNSVSGSLTFFDLSMLIPDGGNVVTIQPFSYDGGQGISSYTVIVLDTGEMLVYAGSDPSNASTWTLSGRYSIGVPVGRRAVCRQGGDVYLTASDDYQKLSVLLAALAQGIVAPLSKASGAIKTAAELGADLFGWDAIYYPRGRRLIFNVPELDGSYSQHVLNTATNAWCRYRGLSALCWVVFNGKPYFGAAGGQIYEADTGFSDITSEALPAWDTSPWDTTPWSTPNYTPITANGQQAWQILNQNVQNKRVAMVRPILSSIGAINFQFGVGFDYVDPFVAPGLVTPLVTSPWDISPWDTTPWGGDKKADNDWHVSSGIGSSVSVVVNVSAVQSIAWTRTDLRFEQGTAL